MRNGVERLLGSSFDWMLVLAWIVVIIYLFLTVVHRDLPAGIFLLPTVLLLLSVSYLMDGPARLQSQAQLVVQWQT